MASKVFVFDLNSMTNFPKNENFLPPDAHTHVSNTDLETISGNCESLLKMMKNAFYFTLKSPFILEVFRFLFLLFGHVRKRLVKGTLMQI